MTAPQPKLEVKVTFAWWLKPYLSTLIFIAVLMGVTPDWEKVGRVIRRAMRIRVTL